MSDKIVQLASDLIESELQARQDDKMRKVELYEDMTYSQVVVAYNELYDDTEAFNDLLMEAGLTVGLYTEMDVIATDYEDLVYQSRNDDVAYQQAVEDARDILIDIALNK